MDLVRSGPLSGVFRPYDSLLLSGVIGPYDLAVISDMALSDKSSSTQHILVYYNEIGAIEHGTMDLVRLGPLSGVSCPYDSLLLSGVIAPYNSLLLSGVIAPYDDALGLGLDV